jgi:hypothetical protein
LDGGLAFNKIILYDVSDFNNAVKKKKGNNNNIAEAFVSLIRYNSINHLLTKKKSKVNRSYSNKLG